MINMTPPHCYRCSVLLPCQAFALNLSCVTSQETWSPDLLEFPAGELEISNKFFSDYDDFHPRLSNCSLYWLEPSDEYFINSEGGLTHLGHANTSDYCIENKETLNGSWVTKVLRCAKKQSPVLPSQDEPSQAKPSAMQNLNILICNACGTLSLICLGLVYLVYSLLPGFNTTHGRIVKSNVVSVAMLTLYLLLVLNCSHSLGQQLCTVVGFSGYFSSTAMFSWMTVMRF